MKKHRATKTNINGLKGQDGLYDVTCKCGWELKSVPVGYAQQMAADHNFVNNR